MDGLLVGVVVIFREEGIFNEGVLFNKLIEFVLWNEVVGVSIDIF